MINVGIIQKSNGAEFLVHIFLSKAGGVEVGRKGAVVNVQIIFGLRSMKPFANQPKSDR